MVPHLADRRQARRVEDPGQDHRRRHRGQCHGGARAHRARPQQAARHARRRPQQFPDDGLAELELSIHPEDVTPILRKLIQPTNTRARIYARDGTLIVDTARSLAQWTALRHEPGDKQHPKTQNVWSMVTRYFFKEPIPVYQEIGSGNGMAYKEVRAALEG